MTALSLNNGMEEHGSVMKILIAQQPTHFTPTFKLRGIAMRKKQNGAIYHNYGMAAV